MKYFFDTEFIDLIDDAPELLSIGVVAEDGREFYHCNRGANLKLATDWVIWNVFPHLGVINNGGDWYWKELPKQDSTMRWAPEAEVIPRSEIRDRLKRFVGEDPVAQFVGYYSSYDWVILCQLFGRMIDLPKGWKTWCFDVKQAAEETTKTKICCGSATIRLPKQESTKHHALHDARWVRDAYNYLMSERKRLRIVNHHGDQVQR